MTGGPVPIEWREAMRAGSLRCHYCPEVATTWDHIVARSLGGPDHHENLTPACAACNLAKESKLPVCRCCRCQQAVCWWRTYLPDEVRRRVTDRLSAHLVELTSVLAALSQPA